MAKISARGAYELARYKKACSTDSLGDATLVLCSDGRLLVKHYTGGGYTILGKLKKTVDTAEAKRAAADRIAAKLGYTKVRSR